MKVCKSDTNSRKTNALALVLISNSRFTSSSPEAAAPQNLSNPKAEFLGKLSTLDFGSDWTQFSGTGFKKRLRTTVVRQTSKGSFVGYMRIAFETESVDILLWLHLYTNCSGSLRKAALKCASTQILYCCHGPAAAAKGTGESKQLHTPHFSMSSPYLAAIHWDQSSCWSSRVQSLLEQRFPVQELSTDTKVNISVQRGSFWLIYDKLAICDKLKGQWYSEFHITGLTPGHPDTSFQVKGGTGTHSKIKVTPTHEVSSTS